MAGETDGGGMAERLQTVVPAACGLEIKMQSTRIKRNKRR
jgi:hypothetical protein